MRKLFVLTAVFDTFKTAGEVARDTVFTTDDFKRQKRDIQYALNKYRHHFTHPYVFHERLKRSRCGGKIAYRCSDKGRRMVCELTYRLNHGLSLKWNQRYHIICTKVCEGCKFNPIVGKNSESIQRTSI